MCACLCMCVCVCVCLLLVQNCARRKNSPVLADSAEMLFVLLEG